MIPAHTHPFLIIITVIEIVKVVKIKCSSTEHKGTKITGQTKFIAYHNRVLKIKSIHEVY